jgi:hypothetical protein
MASHWGSSTPLWGKDQLHWAYVRGSKYERHDQRQVWRRPCSAQTLVTLPQRRCGNETAGFPFAESAPQALDANIEKGKITSQ